MELFAFQNRRLAEAAARLAILIKSLPADARYQLAQPRVLIVGGFIRDVLRGDRPKDLDLEVYGVSPERLEELLHQLYPGLISTVGRAFGILKIHLGEDIEFDVALPRRESKNGAGHKGFLVMSDPGMTVEEAARRRDFTINAIAADPLTGELIDPFQGADDVRQGILRVVDLTTFQDDPLRVYRAVQLVARMGLTVESRSMELMRTMVRRGDLQQLAKERVTEELKKLFLKANIPSRGFALARELGIIERDYPELQSLIGTPQEPEWHPEGDVWIHTLMVLDSAAKIIRQPERALSAEEQLEVMLGSLCHDLGKPPTTIHEEGRIRSRGHEDAGEVPTASLCAHWSFGERVERAAVAIAMNHLKPGMLHRALEKGELDEQRYVNAVRKLLKRIYPTSWRVLIAAAEADYRGRGLAKIEVGPYTAGDTFRRVIQDHALDAAPKKPLLSGDDLLTLGLKPGKYIGEIIRTVEERRDMGEITTRKEALSHAKKLLGT